MYESTYNSVSNSSSFKSNCLEGKVALVTGGGSGIGKAITKKFLQLGCTTIILSRNLEKLNKAAEELEKETGKRCTTISADVRDYERIEAVVDNILSKFKKIDILVNSAAGNFLSSIENLSLKGLRTVMEIDAYGVFILSHVIFKKYFKYNGGIIINLSMTLHYSGSLFQLHAGAAKGAIDAMTKHMAVEWGPYGIRVNAIAPGAIGNTVGLKKILLIDEEEKEKEKEKNKDMNYNMVDYIPIQRYGTGEDIANLTVFLSLDESNYITGTILFVDGGQSLVCNNPTAVHPSIRNIYLNELHKTKQKIQSKL